MFITLSQIVSYLDLLGEGCAEHHGLTDAFRRHRVLLHDASDLGLETHVQHAVGLVQDQEAAQTCFTFKTGVSIRK